MPKLDQPGESSGAKIGKGVYVSTVTAVGYTDKSNHPRWKDRKISVIKGDQPADLWLELATKNESDFERKQSFFGYYKTDPVTGAIKGWKAFANGVQELLTTLLGFEAIENGLNDDYSIPPELLDSLVGKKYMKVSYVSGTYTKDGIEKPSYRDWNRIFPEDTPIDEITQLWEKVSINLKTYTPDVMDMLSKEDDSFKYGANTKNDEYDEEDVI